MPFVDITISTDSTSIADAAIQRLMNRWEGWQPNDADMEVIQIETLAPMAQDAAEVAAQVPDAVFRQYGVKLYGLGYQTGLPAVGVARFTAMDNTGWASDDVVEIGIQGIGFGTDDPIYIPPGSTTVDAPITALIEDSSGNELSGNADPITALPWLVSVEVAGSVDGTGTLIGSTSGGLDPETDADYQDRLSDTLQLQSTTLVTAADFTMMAVNQPGIGRALTSINQARQVTTAVTNDTDGMQATTQAKDDLEAIFEQYRQVNTTYSVIDATYTTINVVFAVIVIPGYMASDVHDRCVQAVQNWLDPMNWGKAQGQIDPQTYVWLNTPVARYSELLRVLAIDGVRYVDTVNTKLNGGTVDVNLPGTAPLTQPGSITGTAT